MQSEEDRIKTDSIFNEGINSFKLTRRQKRQIFKNDKFSNRVKQLLK